MPLSSGDTVSLATGEPEARAAVFARIGGFLNENIYDFGVNVGEAREVK